MCGDLVWNWPQRQNTRSRRLMKVKQIDFIIMTSLAVVEAGGAGEKGEMIDKGKTEAGSCVTG